MAQQIHLEPGWPCASLGPNPPPVQDILSYPTPQQLLPQVLQLTPREAAWGTDEAAALGGQSPAYYICLAQTLGYTITIEERTQFLCDVSECVGASVIESSFTCDDGICGETPLSAITTTEATDYGDPVSDQQFSF